MINWWVIGEGAEGWQAPNVLSIGKAEAVYLLLLSKVWVFGIVLAITRRLLDHGTINNKQDSSHIITCLLCNVLFDKRYHTVIYIINGACGVGSCRSFVTFKNCTA